MKFFIAIAVLAVAASARILPADLQLTPTEQSEIEEILAAIHSPSTDPTTAVLLEQMLLDLLGLAPVKPPVNVPAIIDQFEPIHIGPAIVDFPIPAEALEPTPIAPAPIAPVAPAAPSNSPLVQIIVNVKQQGQGISPVQVDNMEEATPVIVVDNAEDSEIKPTPVIVVEEAEESIIKPTPVIVVEEAEAIPEPVLIGQLPEPVIVAPIIVAPAVVGPETLN